MQMQMKKEWVNQILLVQINNLEVDLSEKQLGAKLRVTGNGCVVFDFPIFLKTISHIIYVKYIYIYTVSGIVV